jgi:uncharacterized protein (TIGR03435 family)
VQLGQERRQIPELPDGEKLSILVECEGPHAVNVIFSALQEQLGLRLQPQRADVQMLVIDRIERAPAQPG